MLEYTTVKKERDTLLSAWGPYSKQLAGISHISDKQRGRLLEFSVFPAQYRGATQVSCELYQGNYSPWFAENDLSSYGYRFQLEWKDRVYTDVSYRIVEDTKVLVKIECRNNTEMNQNICLHYLAAKTQPEWTAVSAGAAVVIDTLNYADIKIASQNLRDGLTYDGKLTCEVYGAYYNGHALGDVFGHSSGDTVSYKITGIPQNADMVYIHAKGNADFFMEGICSGELKIDSDDPAVYSVAISDCNAGVLKLCCRGGNGIIADCIVIGFSKELPRFYSEELHAAPKIEKNSHNIILKYADTPEFYGIYWQGEQTQIREICTDRLEYFMPYQTHNHVSNKLGEDENHHYSNVFIRPICLEPHSTKTFYGSIVCGEKAAVRAELQNVSPQRFESCFAHKPDLTDKYALSQQLMRAALLTNVVFPVRLQGNYIRHFTPGKWWDSLYTWDNGFIAMAFVDFAPRLAEDCLNTYLMEKDNIHAAFVHHGSMLPIQAFVYKRYYDKTCDKQFLAKYYDAMRQYYMFYSGRSAKSRTKDQNSGLLRTFDYFYNSGGWDDYPPQKYIHEKQMADRVCPVVNTAHAINFARIMVHAAKELGLDSSDYENDIKVFSDALQKNAYDRESGYYGYVIQEDNKNACRLLKSADGSNYNMGLDGAYPFMANVCSKEQRERIINLIMSPEHLWTNIGISAVDKSAPYFSNDGYWNGSVWMPHQWFVFLGMLEYGCDDYSEKIAITALDLWKNETEYSYHCYEHFMIESGRGAGWHCFGGLSSPVAMWYNALYVPGTVNVPLNLRIVSKSENQKGIRIVTAPSIPESGESSILAAVKNTACSVNVNGKLQNCKKTGNALFIHVSKSEPSEIRIEY